MACQHSLIRLVKALLNAGANANAQTLIANDGCSTYRQTPMHVAVMASHRDVVKALLDFKGTIMPVLYKRQGSSFLMLFHASFGLEYLSLVLKLLNESFSLVLKLL